MGSDVKVDVLFPPDFAVPKGVVHFVGGAVVGAFPRASYGPFLERLALAVRACVVTVTCMRAWVQRGVALR